MSAESVKNEGVTKLVQNRPQEIKADDNLLLSALNINNLGENNSINLKNDSPPNPFGDQTFDVNQNPSAGDLDNIFGALAAAGSDLPQPPPVEGGSGGNGFGNNVNNTDKSKNTPALNLLGTSTVLNQNLLGAPVSGRFVYNPTLENSAKNIAQELTNASLYVRNYGVNALNQTQWALFNSKLQQLHLAMATIANNYGGNVQPYAANPSYGGNNWMNGGNPWFNNLCRCFANIMFGNPASNNANGNQFAFDAQDLFMNYVGYNQMWADAGVNGLPYGITGV